jgi:hypothetical protein
MAFEIEIFVRCSSVKFLRVRHGTQGYQLTAKGQTAITALLAAQNASTKQLVQLAV